MFQGDAAPATSLSHYPQRNLYESPHVLAILSNGREKGQTKKRLTLRENRLDKTQIKTLVVSRTKFTCRGFFKSKILRPGDADKWQKKEMLKDLRRLGGGKVELHLISFN